MKQKEFSTKDLARFNLRAVLLLFIWYFSSYLARIDHDAFHFISESYCAFLNYIITGIVFLLVSILNVIAGNFQRKNKKTGFAIDSYISTVAFLMLSFFFNLVAIGSFCSVSGIPFGEGLDDDIFMFLFNIFVLITIISIPLMLIINLILRFGKSDEPINNNIIFNFTKILYAIFIFTIVFYIIFALYFLIFFPNIILI